VLFRSVLARAERSRDLFRGACGACALWDLSRAGVASVKVVDRSYPSDRKVRDVGFIAKVLSRLHLPKKPFCRWTREQYRLTYKRDCGFRCIY
jgi:hypothetical protein